MSKEKTLHITGLHVTVEGKEVLKGVDLTVKPGQTHALMGPNGSGKSTLANVILGHPKYTVTQGDILYGGKSVLTLAPDERARQGLFLAFQYPAAIAGVTLEEFLLAAYRAQGHTVLPFRFRKLLHETMALVKMDPAFSERFLNHGFSGGEKKKAEILQLALLQPDMAILDETDSGLDVDALKAVTEAVHAVQDKRESKMGLLLVTHYQRILKHLKPDHVHVMKDGRIVKSGGREFAEELEDKGYEWIH